MRLQQAIDGGDREAATQALFEARQIVDVDIASVANQPTTDLPSILDTLIASWEGLVTITANIDQPPAASQRVLKLIEDVVTEGINNAVRHGDADRIDITIAEQQSSIQISISDNGTAGPPSGRRGTGTRLLDALAPNSWSRTVNQHGGSTLTVDLPLAAALN
jgi:Signal transduction histidine kinase